MYPRIIAISGSGKGSTYPVDEAALKNERIAIKHGDRFLWENTVYCFLEHEEAVWPTFDDSELGQLRTLETLPIEERTPTDDTEHNRRLHPRLPHDIVGDSAAMHAVRKLVAEAGATDNPILILGEVGTGKRYIGEAIHIQSARSEAPFLWFHCPCTDYERDADRLFGYEKDSYRGAYKPHLGDISMAEGGTLFLGAVDEMPLYMQDKLIQFMRGGTFLRYGAVRVVRADVRVMAATSGDLDQAVEDGRFQADLYRLLQTSVIRLPPLRERASDIPLLVEHFIRNFARIRQVAGISREAMAMLKSRPWKGNVLELRSTIERAMSHGESERLELRDVSRD